jgi:UDP-N-acetylglucosamine acyltransferase
MIHPTAVIHPKAQLDGSVEVGPFSIIDAGVTVGPGCRIGPHVYLTGNTSIGANNRFYANAVIGEAPQDVKYSNEPTGLRIGDNNLFREGATVHRSNRVDEETVVGSNNFLMVNCHVGHNARVGNHVIIANGALVAGHVEVGDRAFISGNCLLHQFVRVGSLALMQGAAKISKDLPPFTIARGDNGICGLNVIGLRRAGVGSAERLELKKLYHRLFRSNENLSLSVSKAREEFTGAHARAMLDFIAAAKRGVCRDFGNSAGEAGEASEADI